jgi:thioredoxin reductase (NADPH)
MVTMLSQAEAVGAKFIYEAVQALFPRGNVFDIQLTDDCMISAKTVIIATGAKHKSLNIKGEKEFTNRGVSWCATCDGAFYKNKNVVVVGGGNTAVMEAIYLSGLAAQVTLIHRRNSLRAEANMQEKLFKKTNITCIWDSELSEIIGTDKVGSVTFKNNQTGEKKQLAVDGMFIAIGTIPSSNFVKNLSILDDERYIITNETNTSLPGLFAAGDVVSGSLKQAIYAAGQGALAAKKAEMFLLNR